MSSIIGVDVLRKCLLLVLVLLISLSLVGCQTPLRDGESQVTPTAITDDVTSPAITEIPKVPQLLIFVNRLSGWESVGDELEESMRVMAAEKGWDLQSFSSLSEVNVQGDPVLFVIAGGDAELSEEIDRYPDAFFILVAVTGAIPAERVAVIGPEGMRSDKVAFLGGFIAAMLTPSWRVGVIGVEEGGEGRASIKSFLNGAVFFCGLCRTLDPPFHEYPTSTSVANSDASSLRSGYEQLSPVAIKTIGLTHEFSSDSVDTVVGELASVGINWIGPTPPSAGSREHWIATILPFPAGDIKNVYERLVLGEGDVSIAMSFDIRDVHMDLLSEGKLELVLEIMRDLERGVIDTGVDPQTGQDR
jgi:hypothetical protein